MVATAKPATPRPSSSSAPSLAHSASPTDRPRTFSPSAAPGLPTLQPTTAQPSQSPSPPTTWSPTTLSPTFVPSKSPSTWAPSRSPTPPTCSPLPAPPRPVISGFECGQFVNTSLVINEIHKETEDQISFSLLEVGLGQPLYCQAALAVALDNNTDTWFVIAQPQSGFVYQSTQGKVFGVPSIGANSLPLGLNFTSTGLMLGYAQELLSLSAFAVIVVSYPDDAPLPLDFLARIDASGLTQITAWNHTGYLDPLTGALVPPLLPGTGYPFCIEPPVFSRVFWAGISVADTAPQFQPPQTMGTIVSAFSAISWTGIPFTYQDQADYSQYTAGVVFSAIPFWAMAGLCLLMWPTVFVVSRLTCKKPVVKEQSLQEHRETLMKKLRPAPVGGRLCFLIVSGILVVLVVLMIVSTALFPSEVNNVRGSAQAATTVFANAQHLALEILAVVNYTRSAATGKTVNHTALNLESTYLAQLATMLTQEYYRADEFVNVNPVAILTVVVRIVYLIVATPLPFIVIWCVILASCTFRWKSPENILCKTPSWILGPLPRPLFVLTSTASWLCVSIAYINLTIVADVCKLPSLLGIPQMLPNDTTVLPYNPNGYSYSANGFNWAAFYQSCQYRFSDWNTTSSGAYLLNPTSPYFLQIFAAYDAHEQVLRSALGSSPAAGLPSSYLALDKNLTALLNTLDCRVFGMASRQATNDICTSYVYILFLGFISMFWMPVVLMVMTPFIDWISPNLYRVKQADLFYQTVSKARQVRIKSLEAESLLHPPPSTRSKAASMSSRRFLLLKRSTGNDSLEETAFADEQPSTIKEESSRGRGANDGDLVQV